MTKASAPCPTPLVRSLRELCSARFPQLSRADLHIADRPEGPLFSIGSDAGAKAIAARGEPSLGEIDAVAIGPLVSIQEAISAIDSCSQVKRLDVSVDGVLPEALLCALGRLQALVELTLSGRGIDDSGLFALGDAKGLKKLDLRSVPILGGLPELPCLEHLDLSRTGISAAAVEGIVASSPKLRALFLRSCSLGDGAGYALLNARALERLDVHDNGLCDPGACAIATLMSLVELFAGNNKIGDRGAEALAGLPRLSSLFLGGNDVGDAGARALGEAPCLQILELEANLISSAGREALLARGFRTLLLDGNPRAS